MPHVVDTDKLVADGVIDVAQSAEIIKRSRALMVSLAINTILCFGILAATLGLIFWLADALSVAIFGFVALAAGLFILAKAKDLYSMFGNSAALIGAGMLIGGAGIELVDKYEDIAGWVMVPGGALIAGIAGRALVGGGFTTRFVQGSILLMGLAMHLIGIGLLIAQHDPGGWIMPIVFLYTACLIAAAGYVTDVRFVTALAIAPFAQMLDTSTSYFHAAYVFYSPEPVLSIIQMAVLVAIMLWVVANHSERIGRHAFTLAIMGFIVLNLCALVGSLWGDVVGQSMWGPDRWSDSSKTWEDWQAEVEAFKATTLVISANVFSILWAVFLAACIVWAAFTARRGLFNASMTFAAIHAYTQLFESFADEPLAYVIGGLAAIPLAWGMWRADGLLAAQKENQ